MDITGHLWCTQGRGFPKPFQGSWHLSIFCKLILELLGLAKSLKLVIWNVGMRENSSQHQWRIPSRFRLSGDWLLLARRSHPKSCVVFGSAGCWNFNHVRLHKRLVEISPKRLVEMIWVSSDLPADALRDIEFSWIPDEIFTFHFHQGGNIPTDQVMSCETWKKPSYFPLYWLFNRDTCNDLL